MFIVNLTYIKPLDAVEKYLEKHINFLNQYYTKGLFIASGRKNPRTGGIILVRAKNKEAVQEIITHDPFYQNKIANMMSLNLRQVSIVLNLKLSSVKVLTISN